MKQQRESARPEKYLRSGPTTAAMKKKRGNLPKASVQMLKEWMEVNCFDAYPNDKVKHTLSKETKLSLLQVNNWFINARRRILPTMIRSKGGDPSLHTVSRRISLRTLRAAHLKKTNPTRRNRKYGESSKSSDSDNEYEFENTDEDDDEENENPMCMEETNEDEQFKTEPEVGYPAYGAVVTSLGNLHLKVANAEGEFKDGDVNYVVMMMGTTPNENDGNDSLGEDWHKFMEYMPF